jgi:hypothetical protein
VTDTDMANASLVDAFIDGQHVAKLGLSFSLNPFQDGTPEHDAWARGWQGASAMRAAGMVA